MPCGDDRRLYAFCYGEAMEQEGVEMKTLIAIAMLVAGNCWGQMAGSTVSGINWELPITNVNSWTCTNQADRAERVMARITRDTVTNRVHAKQHRQFNLPWQDG